MEYLLLVVGWLVSGITAWVTAYKGARYGAVEADRLAQRKREQEAAERRLMLFEALRTQLALIAPNNRPYDVSKGFQWEQYGLTALPRLLDGETLADGSYRALVESLLVLEAMVGRYNNFVQVAHLVQQSPNLPDSGHRQLYDGVVERHQALLQVAAAVLKQLEVGGLVASAPSPSTATPAR
jgi:hypothetical protein